MTNKTPEHHESALAAGRLKAEGRILSPKTCCAIGGFSLATWNRTYRPVLPVVRISSRRIGTWDYDFFAELERRTAGGQANGSAT